MGLIFQNPSFFNFTVNKTLLRLISMLLLIFTREIPKPEIRELQKKKKKKEMRRFGGSRGIGRTVGRAGGGGGVQEAITNRPILNKPSSNTSTSSSSSNNNSTSLLSNLSVSASIPVLAAASNVSSFFPPGHSSCSFFYDSDEWDWETVDGEEEEDIGDANGIGFYDRLVFGKVPSKDEVEDVVSALKQVSSAGSQLDWIEPAMHVCNPKMLRSHGYERVYDAFHLLQKEPTVQRMVIALSTDKAVWNAVLSNEVVQEIKEAFYAAENDDGLLKSGESPDAKKSILKLFLEKSKTKVMELIEKVSDLLSSIFQSQETEKDTGTNKFEGNLRYSFMLSTVVLLIVILNRVYRV